MADLHLWILTPWEAGFLRSNCAHNVDRPVTPMISIWKNMSLKGEQKTGRPIASFLLAPPRGSSWGRSGAYLSSERAVPNILRDSPDARFIVMMRCLVLKVLRRPVLYLYPEPTPPGSKGYQQRENSGDNENIHGPAKAKRSALVA